MIRVPDNKDEIEMKIGSSIFSVSKLQNKIYAKSRYHQSESQRRKKITIKDD